MNCVVQRRSDIEFLKVAKIAAKLGNLVGLQHDGSGHQYFYRRDLGSACAAMTRTQPRSFGNDELQGSLGGIFACFGVASTMQKCRNQKGPPACPPTLAFERSTVFVGLIAMQRSSAQGTDVCTYSNWDTYASSKGGHVVVCSGFTYKILRVDGMTHDVC